jgi:hypothetical protein
MSEVLIFLSFLRSSFLSTCWCTLIKLYLVAYSNGRKQDLCQKCYATAITICVQFCGVWYIQSRQLHCSTATCITNTEGCAVSLPRLREVHLLCHQLKEAIPSQWLSRYKHHDNNRLSFIALPTPPSFLIPVRSPIHPLATSCHQ